MITPERLSVNWDAANAYDHLKNDVKFISADGKSVEVAPQVIENALARQAGRLFTLLAYAAEVALYLRVEDYDERNGLTMVSRYDPVFKGVFRVAADPMPRVAYPHGDVVFDLVRQDTPEV